MNALLKNVIQAMNKEIRGLSRHQFMNENQRSSIEIFKRSNPDGAEKPRKKNKTTNGKTFASLNDALSHIFQKT